MREQDGLPPLFKVKSLTLELQFTVEESKNANGTLGIRVVEASASKEITQSSIHKMIIHMDTYEDLDEYSGVSPSSW